MRTTLIFVATGFALAIPVAQAQDAPTPTFTGTSGPRSATASNLEGSHIQSYIAPHFDAPGLAVDGSPETFLNDAKTALARGRTGAAQEALERAETRILSRSTEPSLASKPDDRAEATQVATARAALGRGDKAAAMTAIDAALASAMAAGHTDMMGKGTMTNGAGMSSGGQMMAPQPSN